MKTLYVLLTIGPIQSDPSHAKVNLINSVWILYLSVILNQIEFIVIFLVRIFALLKIG